MEQNVHMLMDICCIFNLAPFPGHSHHQYLITCSIQVRKAHCSARLRHIICFGTRGVALVKSRPLTARWLCLCDVSLTLWLCPHGRICVWGMLSHSIDGAPSPLPLPAQSSWAITLQVVISTKTLHPTRPVHAWLSNWPALKPLAPTGVWVSLINKLGYMMAATQGFCLSSLWANEIRG